jgi:hypothetical protein
LPDGWSGAALAAHARTPAMLTIKMSLSPKFMRRLPL